MSARQPTRAFLLSNARALIQQACSDCGLSQAEVLGVLYTLNANADMRQFSEHDKDLFLDLIAALEPEEEPELSSFRTLEPATLDQRIER